MLITILNVIAILLALTGILYLMLFGMRAESARDRKVMFVMTIAVLLSFAGVMISVRGLDKKTLLAVELLYAITIWLVIFLYIRFSHTLVSAGSKYKKFFDALVEGCSQGIVIMNKVGEVVAANAKAMFLFDCDKGDELHHKLQQLVQADTADHPGEDTPRQDMVLKENKNSKEGLKVSKHPFTWETEEYEVLFVEDTPLPSPLSQGLEWHQEFHNVLMDLAPVFLLAIGSDGRILYINNHGKKLLGVTEGGLNGNWLDHIPPEIRSEAMEFFLNPRAATVSFTCPIIAGNTEGYCVRWRWAGMKDLENIGHTYVFSGEDVTAARNERNAIDEELTKVIGANEELEVKVTQRTKELKDLHHDLHNQIRERKYIENELLNSQRLYNTLAYNFPNGIIGVLNKDLRYVMLDGKELERMKVKADDLIGRRIFEIYPDANVYETKLRKAFSGEHVSFDVELSGSIYNIIAVALPDMQRDEIKEILVIISNITQWKRLEEDLHRVIAKERNLVELKSRFVTMASHEFRTPLGTILSSVFLLERYNDSGYEEKRAIHINRIKKTVNNLTEVLNDFLSIGKLEEGKVQAIPRQTNIVEAIKDVVKEMRSLKKPDQRIEYTARGQSRTVMVDSHLLHNTLMNLISNAIKYSPVNGTVSVISDLADDCLLVYVIDHGLGILEEDQPHIFERFFRSRNATSIDGTGLGLHIVKKYVELMHGSIDFTSDENGTTFKVLIPVE
ncbi:PAS domain-containing protein [Fulvivirgaceae bacterium PWU4]|uniref:histidine kinase n=1 Tax=Chryseosolibacter histidini TaxID=2782349 RepID=A0AAP2GS65_9BACT|nr:ATP-binding protein [Chryseosolibacter histidini]MBT1700357.1 PAS domain-containing protein [Chryseosolibacter histidini]